MNIDLSFYSWELVRDYLLRGLAFSLILTVIATLGGILLGTVLAIARMSSKAWLRLPVAIYVDGMRSIPLVMVILWFFLLMPAGFYSLFGATGATYRSELSAAVTFIAFEAAYFSEIARAGIQSITRSQVNAGSALGMTFVQNMRLIILPQAFRNMRPIFVAQVIILFQSTSLVYAIGAYDMLKGFETAGNNYSKPIEAYLLYFIVCYSMSFLAKQAANKRHK
jgi:glutamate/aspartate transport system permease protein